MSDPGTEPSAAQQPEAPAARPSSGAPAGEETISDGMLLLGARLRDESALAMLFDRYGGLVYTLALRIVSERDRAEKVVQDVFLRCWHGLEPYDGSRGTLPGWLLGITRRRAIDLVRGRQHQGSMGEREPRPTFGEREPEVPEAGDEVDLGKDVRRALAELSEVHRAALELAYYGGLTQTEVADRLDEPLGAVKIRIRDGLRRLRRLLGQIVDVRAVRGSGAP